MVRIRLSRLGRKKLPFYRVVAADIESPRNGRFLEILGTYDPAKEPVALTFKTERVEYWLGKGAQFTDTCRSLWKQYQKRASTEQNQTVNS